MYARVWYQHLSKNEMNYSQHTRNELWQVIDAIGNLHLTAKESAVMDEVNNILIESNDLTAWVRINQISRLVSPFESDLSESLTKQLGRLISILNKEQEQAF